MYLHKELETLTREGIEKLQLDRLQKTVKHCMNSAFYRKRFEENGLTPDDIQSLDDLQKIPFTTKQDLRDNYPFGIAKGRTSAFIEWYNRKSNRHYTYPKGLG